MAKFCGKCGSKVDEVTGLCPNCDVDKPQTLQVTSVEDVPCSDNESKTEGEKALEKPVNKKETKKAAKKQKKADKKAAKRAKKKAKRAAMTTGQKIRRFFLKLIAILLLVAIVAVGAAGLLVYFNVMNIPVVEALLDDVGITSDPSFVSQPANDCYIPSEDNIVYENESKSLGYVNNVILVFLNGDISAEKINEIADSVEGKIIGKIAGINQYQIQIDAKEKEELEAICTFLMENDAVKFAIIDSVVTTEENATQPPNDPWKDTFQGFWGVDWDEEHPSGYNWWIEATNVLSAWGYDDHLSTINVGVVDNGFDTNHEDLKIHVLNSELNSAEDHGTHVAGVIGATIDNGVGISGILNHVNLYGVDCYATSQQKKKNVTVSSLMDGIVACLDNQCKIVNMSSGLKFTSKDETKKAAKDSARDAIIYLISMLDSYDDFIVVQSAGNGNKAQVGVDALQYSGFFASINEDSIRNVFDEKQIKRNQDITVQDVLDSFMVVGAVDKKQKNGKWQLSKFSNFGDSITVCAPGVDVFSTIVSGGIDGTYGCMSGTSMAAPIVSGITAMVWSANPTMSAGEVQELLITAASEAVLSKNKNDNGTYRLIDASAAVEAAINYQSPEKEDPFDESDAPIHTTSGERDIVLTLDVSGSMAGTPMEETKKASTKFVDTILNEDASIGIVTYDNNANRASDFSVNKSSLENIVSGIHDGGGTNIEAGLMEARSMLGSSNAKKKIIVLMSDGEPNDGKKGDDLVAYADEIKDSGVLIYTLGFFGDLGGAKSSAQILMERIASEGCHYEVASADDLVFFFDDVADQINGQRYVYIRIACPVDVTVSYNGETLSSAENGLNTRTDFGTLSFEESDENSVASNDDRIKVLRLKEGIDYKIQIAGTGRGMMNYTIGFMDENGDYSDFRTFENVKITKQTAIDTVAEVSDATLLRIDNNGDGKYDLQLRAKENGNGEEVKQMTWLYVSIGGGVLIFVVLVLLALKAYKRRKKKRVDIRSKFCSNCGVELDVSAKVCGQCGTPVKEIKFKPSGVKIADSEKQKKVKKIVKLIIGLIALILVAIFAIHIVSSFTGYKGLLKKVMNAYEGYDIDTLVSMSSDMYYYGTEDFVENYFENNVGNDLDYFENAVGHDYKLSYKVEETYALSDRKLSELLRKVEQSYSDFDVDAIQQVIVADVDVTASKNNKSTSRNLQITMTKENSAWKLLYIEYS